MKPWLAAATLATAWLSVQRVQAQAPPASDEARKHYARGVELYDQGADAAALAELERAYQLAPNWKVLYELGVVELAVHDFAAALRYFEQYVDEGKDAIKGARKQEVTDDITRLRQQVATIDAVAPPGAEIKLDDLVVAVAPLAKPLVVNPGHHKLGATKEGLVAETLLLSLAEGDHAHVELVFPEPAPPPPPPPPVPEPVAPPVVPAPTLALHDVHEHPPAPRSPLPLWLGGIATVALASGAVVTGLEALGANDSLTRAKSNGPSTPATLNDLSSRAHAFAIASDTMTTAAVLAAGVTVYLVMRVPSHPAPAAPGVSLEVSLGGASVVGSF